MAHNSAPIPPMMALTVILAIGILVSCSRGVFVECPPDLDYNHESLTKKLVEDMGQASDRSSAALVLEFSAAWRDGGGGDANTNKILIARGAVVPVGRFPGPERPLSLADCISGREPLKKPLDVSAPDVALPVDGRTIDSPEYPLIRDVFVRLEPHGIRGRYDAKKAEVALRAVERRILSRDAPYGEKIVWIVAAGDLMTARGIDKRLRENGPESVFDPEILGLLRSCDLAIANLECPLTVRGKAAVKSYTFRSPPDTASALSSSGLDVVLFGNNHAFDWGREGFSDTLDALRDAGMAAVGAGRSGAEAVAPARFRLKGSPVAVFGLASFPMEQNGWDGRLVAAGERSPGILRVENGGAERIAAWFRDDQLDIVLIHGGREWSEAPDDETRDLCRKLVDLGADIVFGSHPHVTQGMEWRDGKPIFWSLGNFVFPGMDGTPGGEDGIAVLAGFWGSRVLYLATIPLALSSHGVRNKNPIPINRFKTR